MLLAGCAGDPDPGPVPGGPTAPPSAPPPSATAPPAAPPSAIPAPATVGPLLGAGTAYVALGDSYTAGPGLGPALGSPAGCRRSAPAYPHVLAGETGAALDDASCSGARVDDLTDPQPVAGGSNPPQLDALGPGTEVVTLGIGGNDLGFAEIVGSCLSASATASPCRDRFTAGGDDVLRERVDELGPRLADAYAAVGERAPDARLLVVGYPTVLPAEGSGCFPALPVSPGDVTYLRGVLAALNEEIRTRAEAAGATFVDTADPSEDHDVCEPPGRAWIEGVLADGPGLPLHPDATGHAAAARAVLAAR